MLVKNGAYSSLWQLVGDIKPNETKIISLPVHQGHSTKESSSVPRPHSPSPSEPMISVDAPKQHVEQVTSVHTKAHGHQETQALSNPTTRAPSGDHRRAQITMAEIEDHQRRHTYANSLVQAQQNYRELRRLLIKMNGRAAGEKKPRQMTETQSKGSTGQRTK